MKNENAKKKKNSNEEELCLKIKDCQLKLNN